MAGPVYSVVRRNMKHVSQGAFSSSSDDLEPLKDTLPLEDGEELVGLYRNPMPWADTRVVFSTKALYTIEGQDVARVPLHEIIGYESPKSKVEVTGVRVLTNDGFRFVRVAGSFGPNGNRKDAFSFIMTLRGLVSGSPIIRYPEDADGQQGGKVEK